MAQIHVVHENAAWAAPLFDALERRGLPYRDWHLAEGAVDLTAAPPAGVFYDRMSASSHTRGQRFAPELTAALLAWLESHGRRVRNGSHALQLELSKVVRYAALRRHGIRAPATVAAVGRAALGEATARSAGQRFVTKHDTDHNPEAEARTGPSGMAALAALLGRELGALRLGAGAAAE